MEHIGGHCDIDMP